MADRIRELGAEPEVEVILDDSWSTDRITPEGREKLRAAGFAPPAPREAGGPQARPAPEQVVQVPVLRLDGDAAREHLRPDAVPLGALLRELPPALRAVQDDLSSAAELRRLVNSYQLSQAIHVAAVLGSPTCSPTARDRATSWRRRPRPDPRALYRLLRALAAFGLFHEDDARRFSLTDLGDALRSDAPESVAGWAAFVGRRNIRDAWSSLEESIRTGENAFRLAHGISVWEYRAQNPEESEIFDRAMASSSQLVIRSLIDAYDFGRFGTIVDVGGGNGTLLRALLDEYPQLKGVLFDQPHVVEGVDLGERGTVVGGQLLRVRARGRRRVSPQVDHPRLGRRGFGRDPPQREAKRRSAAPGRTDRRTAERGAGDEARRPEHARRPGRAGADARRVPVAVRGAPATSSSATRRPRAACT